MPKGKISKGDRRLDCVFLRCIIRATIPKVTQKIYNVVLSNANIRTKCGFVKPPNQTIFEIGEIRLESPKIFLPKNLYSSKL